MRRQPTILLLCHLVSATCQFSYSVCYNKTLSVLDGVPEHVDGHILVSFFFLDRNFSIASALLSLSFSILCSGSGTSVFSSSSNLCNSSFGFLTSVSEILATSSEVRQLQTVIDYMQWLKVQKKTSLLCFYLFISTSVYCSWLGLF